MTDFLVRIFIKDWENTSDETVRSNYGTLGGLVGIGCNVLLCLAKVVTGLLINSISVMADGFNNLSDAVSSLISVVGAKLAGKPADQEHPFGHGRIEYIVALIVAFLVMQVGFSLLKSSISKIIHPEELKFSMISVGILLGSVAVKLWLAYFNSKLGKKINSAVMRATAIDSLSDVGATGATIFSLLVYGFLHYNIDGIVGLIVSGLVLLAGIRIIKDTLNPLIGESIDPEVYQQVTEFVEKFPKITGSHDLIIHNYGPTRKMASIHVEVSDQMDITEAHELIDQIEREALRQMKLLLVVHTDPVETDDIRVTEHKEMLEQILKEIDDRITYHDFRMVDGDHVVNLIFDIVIPYDYDKHEQGALKDLISEAVSKIDKQYYCIITLDKSYCAPVDIRN